MVEQMDEFTLYSGFCGQSLQVVDGEQAKPTVTQTPVFNGISIDRVGV